MLARYVAHPWRMRRRKEDRLPVLRRGRLEDLLHVLLEPHVEHLVRLVEHHVAQVVEQQPAVVQMVDDAPGRAHEHVDAVAQSTLLRRVRGATRESVNFHAVRPAEHLNDLANLLGELARRHEHEHARRPATFGPLAALLFGQPLHEWQREGESLACPRARAPKHIVPRTQHVVRLGLDGRKVSDALLGEHGDRGLVHVKHRDRRTVRIVRIRRGCGIRVVVIQGPQLL